MTYILVILFLFGGGSNNAAMASVVAEFATLDACWSAAGAITRPFDRDQQWQVATVTTCVAKGQRDF